jgi:hypothetical protein
MIITRRKKHHYRETSMQAINDSVKIAYDSTDWVFSQ